MLKIIAPWILYAACVAPLQGQELFDPVAGSAGGVWMRRSWDPWCALGAQPLLSFVDETRIGVVHSPGAFGLSELSRSAATIVFPLSSGGAGIAFTRFGYDLYSEHAGIVSWGGGSGPLRYGAALRYRLVAISGYGSAGFIGVDIAALLSPVSWMRWGIRLTDVNRPRLGESGERVPGTISVAGVFFLPGLLDVLVQGEYPDRGKVSFRAGVGLRCSPWLDLRCGASDNFSRVHTGVDLTSEAAGVGYGISVDPALGWSHTFSLTIDPPW